MEENRRKMLEQLEDIRLEGKCNMFMERTKVAKEASNKNYHQLFNHIVKTDNRGRIKIDNDKYMDLLEGLSELDD